MSTPVIVVVCVLTAPLAGLVVFLALAPLVNYLERRKLAGRCVSTEKFLRSPAFGLVTFICGNIGAGKTTCGSAICNMLSKIKREQASARAAEIRTVFAGVDFNKVDAVIALAFNSRLTNTDAVMNFVLDRFPDVRKEIEDKFYDDGLYPVSYTSLLRDYVDAVIALVRNRYVYFNRRKFYCWTTDTWAMDYEPGMIDLKDRFESKDYRIQRYTTIFEDEKVLSGKVSTNFADVAREDGGGDTFLRLIRQLGKGTVHYISTAQDFARVVKQERELATGVLYIRKRRILEAFDLREVAIDLVQAVLQQWGGMVDALVDSIRASILLSVRRRIKACQDAGVEVPAKLLETQKRCQILRSKTSSWSKRLVSRLTVARARMGADSYINYKGIYYTCADDVGKPREECSSAVIDVDFTFPIRYAFGSSDTYAFSVINDYLSLVSIESSDFYEPNDHGIPREQSRTMLAYLRGVLAKRGRRS